MINREETSVISDITTMNFTVKDFLTDFAQRDPKKTAFIADGREISYGDLNTLVIKTSSVLDQLGVQTGDKVAILSPNTLDWFVIELSVAEIGAALVPINTRFKKTEIQYLLKQSDTSFLFVSERDPIKHSYFNTLAELFPDLERRDYQKVRSNSFPRMKNLVSDWGSPKRHLVDVVLSQGDISQTNLRPSSPEDVVLIQYTSGTTSFPKGVMLCQSQVVRNAFNLGTRVGIDSTDLLFSGLPFAHVGGSVLTNLLALTHGACVLTMGRYSADSALELIQKYNPTAINGIDSHFIDIYTHSKFDKDKFPPITKGWIVGTPEVIKHTIEDMGVKYITNVYGLSEASPNVTSSTRSDSDFLRCNRQGVTYPEMEICIVNPLTNEIAPPNSVGEIRVRGYSVMKGYYNEPEATLAVLDRDGWLHTGDQGFIDENGYLAFSGRIKDTLRVGGENVAPSEVEDLLLSYPNVKMAAVIGVPDKRLGEVCYAFVELRDVNNRLDPLDIIRFCKENLASFKVPRAVDLIDSMPMTESGKIQKFKLRELVAKAIEQQNT